MASHIATAIVETKRSLHLLFIVGTQCLIGALLLGLTLWPPVYGDSNQSGRPATESFVTRILPATAPERFDHGDNRFGALWSGMRRSTDGGKTWSWVVPVSSQPFGQPFFGLPSNVFFIQPEVGFLGGRDTWRTTDGGQSWTRLFDQSFSGISFLDSMNGWLALNDLRQPSGENYVTRDGGETWQSCGNGLAPHHAELLTNKLGWGIATARDNGGHGAYNYDGLVKTTDGGCSWNWVFTSFSGEFNSIQFLNDKQGWVAGQESPSNSLLLHTTDGGQTWRTVWNEKKRDVASFYFVDEQHGWVDFYTGFEVTSNGGNTWTPLQAAEMETELPKAWSGGQFRVAVLKNDALKSAQSVQRTQTQLDRAATQRVLPQRVQGFPFPWDGHLNYVTGTVRVTVDGEGNVIDARAIDQSYPEIMQSTLEAARQWKFDMQRLNDPAHRTVTGPIEFIFRPNGGVEEAKSLR
jgi:photosystem II stability/assembly factor-like uncharacterized protein